jgi:hypothetical protein
MTLRILTARGTESLLTAFDAVAAEAVGREGALTCVVPDGGWLDYLKRRVARQHPFGVDIVLWAQYFDGLWELAGDGRQTASLAQRRKALEMAGEPVEGSPAALARFPRVRGVLTPGIVAELLGFYERYASLASFEDAFRGAGADAGAGGDAGVGGGLTEAEQAAFSVFRRYRAILHDHALIDPVDRDLVCAVSCSATTPLGILAPRELAPSAALAIERLARDIDVTLLVEYDRAHPGRVAAEGTLSLFEGRVVVDDDTGVVNASVIAVNATDDASLRAEGVARNPPTCDDAAADELVELGARLYRFQPGIEARGHVRVGESVGPAARPALICRLVKDAFSSHEPRDIVVILNGLDHAEDPLYRQMAVEGIPFESTYRGRLTGTGLGCALLRAYRVFGGEEPVEAVAGVVDEEGAAYELFGLLTSPYSGLDARTAAGLNRKWRLSRGLDGEGRRNDVAKDAAGAELLAAIERAVTASGHEEGIEAHLRLVNLLLANARRSAAKAVANAVGVGGGEGDDGAEGASSWDRDISSASGRTTANAVESEQAAENLAAADDWSAAQAFMACVRELSVFGRPLQARDLEDCTVTLRRCFDPKQDGNRVRLLASREPGPTRADVVIVGDLNADVYPMSVVPGALDDLANKLGLPRPRDLAQRQRALLLHFIEVARERFVFFRDTWGPGGDEARQSALFEELLANYRSADELGPGSGPARVPRSLAPFVTRCYEGSTFWQGLVLPSASERLGLERGRLIDADSRHALMPPAFSPTSLEAYLRCPYAWFLDRRIGGSSIDRGLGALEKGLVAHATLSRLYQTLAERGMARVTPENLPEAHDILRNSFARVLEEGTGDVIVKDRMEREGLGVLEKDLLALLERDATLLPAYRPRFLEQTVEGSYAGVTVRGRIDRLDADGDGRALIIDYKLGGGLADYGIARKDPRVPPHIQGAVYATLAERLWGVRVLGILYRSCRRPVTRGVFSSALLDIDDGRLRKAQGLMSSDALPWLPDGKVADDSFVLRGFSEYLKMVEEQVFCALERLAAGDIWPNPSDKGICGYCSVRASCQSALGDKR